jgi:hypothetical protein
MHPPYATLMTAALACVWIGLLLGVSFLATLAKFNAKNLTRAVALDVGRHTFMWLARAEWVLAILMGSALFIAGLPATAAAAFAGVVVVLLLSAFWIAPQLYKRADTIIAGGMPESSSTHGLAILAEVLKLVLLLAIAAASFRALIAT